jgi:hypothetical protein
MFNFIQRPTVNLTDGCLLYPNQSWRYPRKSRHTSGHLSYTSPELCNWDTGKLCLGFWV